MPNPAPKQPSNHVKPLVENNPDTKPTTEELYRTAKEEIETLKKELAREQKQSDDRKEHGNNLEQQVEEEKQRTGSDELDLTLPLLASLGANFYQYSKRKLSKN